MNKAKLRLSVLADINEERDRQDAKWGIQRHELGVWLSILVEEVGEVAQAMQSSRKWSKPTDASNLYIELIHVAAVSVAIAEQLKEGDTNGYHHQEIQENRS